MKVGQQFPVTMIGKKFLGTITAVEARGVEVRLVPFDFELNK